MKIMCVKMSYVYMWTSISPGNQLMSNCMGPKVWTLVLRDVVLQIVGDLNRCRAI